MRLNLLHFIAAISVSGSTVLFTPRCAVAQAAAPPAAEQRVHVDTLHGIVRTDPYFWLRHKSDPAVAAYLEGENRYAEQTLAPLKGLREQLYNEMLSRIQQTDLSVPYFDNG
jgi:oligopeptidase B